MAKGGYNGGSTLIRPGSSWFSTGRKQKTKDLGKGDITQRSGPRTELEIRVAANLKRGAVRAAERELDAEVARRAEAQARRRERAEAQRAEAERRRLERKPIERLLQAEETLRKAIKARNTSSHGRKFEVVITNKAGKTRLNGGAISPSASGQSRSDKKPK